MSNISSNSLFHFTPKKEYLTSILNQAFIPRYCFEEIKLSDKLERQGIESAIPMVCFCDLSLGQITNHIDMYGSYGLGMTKEWGIRKKLNPIIYVNPNSNITDSISQMAESVYQALEDHCSDVTKQLSDDYMNLINFLKPYDGDFRRGLETIKDVRFYDEREWRYVPKIKFDPDVKSILSRSEFSDPDMLESENKKLIDYSLEFEPKDIKYIFVKNESEIHPLMDQLRQIKSRFSRKEIDVLTSKIITTDQIKQDF